MPVAISQFWKTEMSLDFSKCSPAGGKIVLDWEALIKVYMEDGVPSLQDMLLG